MVGNSLRIIAAVFLAICLMPGPATAGPAKDQIQETLQQVLQVLHGSASASDSARRDNLREALLPRFDWTEMAKRTLGKHWQQNSSRQDEFIAVLAEFLGNAYAGKIGSLRDEKILFGDEAVVDNDALVNTKVVPSKGEALTVNYRLHQVQGEWKIYDVILDDISLVANFRSQFSRILAKGNFEDLLRNLKEKDKESKARP